MSNEMAEIVEAQAAIISELIQGLENIHSDAYASNDVYDISNELLKRYGQLEGHRAAECAWREQVVQKIMQLDSWADIEEVTFPLPQEFATEENQNEWFEEFCKRLEQHVRAVLELP